MDWREHLGWKQIMTWPWECMVGSPIVRAFCQNLRLTENNSSRNLILTARILFCKMNLFTCLSAGSRGKQIFFSSSSSFCFHLLIIARKNSASSFSSSSSFCTLVRSCTRKRFHGRESLNLKRGWCLSFQRRPLNEMSNTIAFSSQGNLQ